MPICLVVKVPGLYNNILHSKLTRATPHPDSFNSRPRNVSVLAPVEFNSLSHVPTKTQDTDVTPDRPCSSGDALSSFLGQGVSHRPGFLCNPAKALEEDCDLWGTGCG